MPHRATDLAELVQNPSDPPHGFDLLIRRWASPTSEHATSRGLVPVPLDPAALADLVVVNSVYIDSPLRRRLRTAGIAVLGEPAARPGPRPPARREPLVPGPWENAPLTSAAMLIQ